MGKEKVLFSEKSGRFTIDEKAGIVVYYAVLKNELRYQVQKGHGIVMAQNMIKGKKWVSADAETIYSAIKKHYK
jgi:hypothetical protein